MKYALSSVALLSALITAGVAQAGLKVGDPAPKLSIAAWIKGSPVDPAKGKPEEVFVMEFWATWCAPCRSSMPHMSKMQEQFRGRGVTFIGISNEDKKTVEKFLKKGFDSKMRYTVAIDSRNQTNKDWMQAAGQQGIPCAFVVKGGTVRWIGHPMDIDDVLAQVEVSDDLLAWRNGNLEVALVSSSTNGDGTATYVFRSTSPLSATLREFIRLRLTLR